MESELSSRLFSLLSAEARNLLSGAVERRAVPAGEIVLHEGEPTNSLYIVNAGEVQVVGRDSHGEHQVLALLGEGESFGELSLLTGEPASATVETVRETELLVLTHEEFARVAEVHPEVLRNVARVVGERLQAANKRYLQKMRGRLTCLFGPPAPAWRVWASYHLARSVARHARRETVFVDLSGTVDDIPEIAPSVRPLTEVVAAAYRIQAEPTGEAVVCYAEPGETEELLAGVHQLQEHATEVIAYVPLGHPDEEAVLSHADELLSVLHESETRHSVQSGAIRQDAKTQPEAIVVFDRAKPFTLREWQRCQVELGPATRLRGLIPGGAEGLSRASLEGSTSGTAVDRLARNLTGLSIGLALGGGGAKGYAHIGVLKVLEGAKVPIDFLAGCSIGAPIAAGIAAGWSISDIREQLDTISRKAVRPTFPLASLLGSRGIRSELHHIAGDLDFEDMTTPAGVVAVCIETGEEMLLRSGSLWRALMASMAYPAIYEPVRIGSRYLVDGGLLNPVPVSAALSLGADVVISSSLAGSADPPDMNGVPPRPLILRTLSRSIEIMQSKIGAQSGSRADVEILPEFTERPGLLDFKRGKQLEEAGERGAQSALPKLRAALPWLA